MRPEDLFKIIGEIDDEIIEDSEALGGAAEAGAGNPGSEAGTAQPLRAETAGVETPETETISSGTKKRRRPGRGWYAALAAAACLLIGIFGIYPVFRMKGQPAMEEAAVEETEEAFDNGAAAEEAAGAEAPSAAYEYDEAAEEAVTEEASAGEAAPEGSEEEAAAEADEDQKSLLKPDNPVGVVLTAENVTTTGLDLVCTQSGGQAEGELQSGTWYKIDKLKDGYLPADGGTAESEAVDAARTEEFRALPETAWETVPYIRDDFGWEDLAILIPENDQVVWPVDWTPVYGDLKPGVYRISKEITDFKGTGNYETYQSYAYFEVAG